MSKASEWVKNGGVAPRIDFPAEDTDKCFTFWVQDAGDLGIYCPIEEGTGDVGSTVAPAEDALKLGLWLVDTFGESE